MIYNINKFSNTKFIFNKKNNIEFIYSLNPNKLKNRNYELISIDSEFIIYDFKKYTIKEFKNNVFNKNIKYIVLSKKEFIFNFFSKILFFNVFPFIKYESYYDDLSIEDKFNTLFNLSNNVNNLLDNRFKSIQHQYKTYLSFKQNKTIHYKSLLDNNFFFSIKPGFSDVFKLLENRKDRSIFQLDVNSMYPFAMIQNNFSIPKNLKYYEYNDLNDILSNKISNGIFNCVLSLKSNLSKEQLNFVKYLPINIIRDNTSIPLDIKFNDQINILLHSNEIKYYSKFFDIILEDGIYSKESMNHPLKNWVLETYQKRLDSIGVEKDFYKFILVLSHSIIIGKEYDIEYYDKNTIYDEVKEKYQFNLNNLELNNSYFLSENIDEDILKLKSYKINNNKNIYSLYSQVLANARIHLLELYEKFYTKSNSFELCYCNIDSLHISIPNDLQEEFDLVLNEISSKTELGKLKIESIGNKGVWFEPGRYWLFKDEELISYKNTIFNDDNSNYKDVFKEVEFIDKFNKYNIKYFNLFKNLQHKKNIFIIDNNNIVYNKNTSDSLMNFINNKNNNIQIYKNIFNKFIKN